jgi:putative DNA primase/helicase
VTQASHFTIGDRQHVVLQMPPCRSPRVGQQLRHDFLRALHPTGFRDLRALKGDLTQAMGLPVFDLAAVDRIVETCRANLYVGVASRAHLNGRELQDGLELHVLFADLDFADFPSESAARAGLAAFPLPSMVVNSGGGLHCYWRLAAPIDLQIEAPRAKQLLRGLAATLGADRRSAEAARILRMPGSLNYKHTPPRPVVVEHLSDTIYPLADLVAAIGPLPDLEPTCTSQPVEHDVPTEQRLRQARAWLDRQSPAIQGQGGDQHTYSICCSVVVGHDLTEDEAFDVLRDWNARCAPPWAEPDLRTKIRNAARYANGPRGERLRLILNPNDPMPSARKLVARAHTVDGTLALRHQNGVFYAYQPDASAYHERDEAAMRADLYRFLESAMRLPGTKEATAPVPFQPTQAKVANVLDALRAVCNLPTTQAPPCWLESNPSLSPIDMLPCQNGLLHVPTRTLYRGTPQFFTLNGIDFGYEPNAPQPEHWLHFVRTLWPEDDQAIATLQEVFGYLLTPDTRQQKIFMMVGPPRSGKGLTGRVLRRLVGERNTCSPTLASFGRGFGKQVLVGKTLAVISDARIGGHTDTAVVAETLLSVSGEDPQTIERKFLADWNGKLAVRFLLLTNELPRIGDVSGALAKRFIVLMLTETFYGREDLGLYDRFMPELPGILNWALEGRDRLYARGYFVQPASSTEVMQEFADLSSPEATFLRQYTCIEVGASVSHKDLFTAWQQWCAANGRDHVGTLQTFGRNVRAALPWITTKREGGRGEQERCWQGLRVAMPGTDDRPPHVRDGQLSGM